MRRGFLKVLTVFLAAWFSLQGYNAVAMPLCIHANSAPQDARASEDHVQHTMHAQHGDHSNQLQDNSASCDNCTFCQLCTVSAIPFSDIIFATEISAPAEPLGDIVFHSYNPPHLSPPPLV